LPKPGQQLEQRGEVLEKIFVKCTPTVIIWDRSDAVCPLANAQEGKDGEDDVWVGMEEVDDDSDANSDVDAKTTSVRSKRRRTG
jgi:ribosome biogenesis protein NSA1